MKTSYNFGFIIAASASMLFASDLPEQKHETIDRNGNGNPERIIDSVYVGSNLIQRTITADTNDDGTPDQKIISCYRGGEKASVFWRHMDQSNRTTRIFYSEGRQVMMDDDERGDGHFETLMILDTNGVPSAIFKIDNKDVPTPMPEAEFKKHVEAFVFGNEVITPVLNAIAETGKTKKSEPTGARDGSPAAHDP